MPRHEPKWGPVLTPEHQDKFSIAIFAITTGSGNVNGAVWNLVLVHTSIRQELGEDKGPVITLAAIPMGRRRNSGSANLVIGVNPTRFFKLPGPAQVELVMITLSKVINGRVGSEGTKLTEQYGRDATELGMLLYLTQAKVVSTKHLEAAGYKVPSIEDFNLPKDQTWRFYTEAIHRASDNLMDTLGNLPTDSVIEEEPDSVDNAMKSLFADLQKHADIKNKGRGLFAGDLSDILKTLFTPPKIAWQEALKFKENGRGRQFTLATKRRNSRRGPPPNFLGHRYVGSCNVVVICDTSGSRTIRQIASITAELRAMVQRGARVIFVQADTVVQNTYEYTGRESDLEVFGRGGTEIQPAIDQLDVVMEKHDIDEIDVLVIATDGETDRLDCKDYETLILLDNDTTPPENYAKMVTGSNVDIRVLELPDKLDDPNVESSGN